MIYKFFLFMIFIFLNACSSTKIKIDTIPDLVFNPYYNQQQATDIAIYNTSIFLSAIKDHPKREEIKLLLDSAYLEIYSANMSFYRGKITADKAINNLMAAIEKYKKLLLYLPNNELALSEVVITYMDIGRLADNLNMTDKMYKLNILLEAEKYNIRLLNLKNKTKILQKNYQNYGHSFCLYGALAYLISTSEVPKDIQYKYNNISRQNYELCLDYVASYHKESLINLIASLYLDYFYFVDDSFSDKVKETKDMIDKTNQFFDKNQSVLSKENKDLYYKYFSDIGFITFLNNYFKKNNIDFVMETIKQ